MKRISQLFLYVVNCKIGAVALNIILKNLEVFVSLRSFNSIELIASTFKYTSCILVVIVGFLELDF